MKRKGMAGKKYQSIGHPDMGVIDKEESWVYGAQEDWGEKAPVKIGKSIRHKERITSHQCGNPRDLKFIFMFPYPNAAIATYVEGSLHELWRTRNVKSKIRNRNEWFLPDDKMVTWLAWAKEAWVKDQTLLITALSDRVAHFAHICRQHALRMYAPRPGNLEVPDAIDGVVEVRGES